eukprot:8273946-Pyramimonas_sp.AAC.1
MQGYSIVLVLFYGLQKSQGVVGDDARRLTRLGAVLAALAFPGIVLGDFNLSPKELNKCRFLDSLDAVAMTADVESTCVAGTGSSHIDYLVVSSAA